MYQTIIVPVDVYNAEKASLMLETAEKLASKDAKLILLNVIEPIPSYVTAQLPKDFRQQDTTKAAEKLEGIAKSTSLETKTEVRSGYASQEILSLANEAKADAIIIASHRPGLEDYFLGSTAARVVRHAKCSVVVIR